MKESEPQSNRSSVEGTSYRPSQPDPSGGQALPIATSPRAFAQWAPVKSLRELSTEVSEHLRRSPHLILSLNRSRKQSILEHLSRLAHLPAPATDTRSELLLTEWLTSTRLSAKQNEALEIYFEEIALVYISKAILLKSWSDRNIRPIHLKDLGDVNDVLAHALHGLVPYDREGWNAMRPSIYSWYKTESSIQRSLYDWLQSVALRQESPMWLMQTIEGAWTERVKRPAASKDLEFFQHMLKSVSCLLPKYDHLQTILGQNSFAFSPTLKSGALLQASQQFGWHWMGTETDLFRLILAELTCLWEKPCRPLVFHQGFGYETMARTQRSFPVLGGKQSSLSLLQELDSCDVAWLDERESLRWSQRHPMLAEAKLELSRMESLQKLRDAQSSIGVLQAVVCATKLRQNGIFVWLRNERLSDRDSLLGLKSMLDHSKLLFEIEIDLPKLPGFVPRFIYIWARETSVEARKNNHPVSMRLYTSDAMISGQAWIEALEWISWNLQSGGPPPRPQSLIRIWHQKSPSPQMDWAVRWPEPTDHDAIERMESLKSLSVPLADCATIRLNSEAMDEHSMTQFQRHTTKQPALLLALEQENSTIPTLTAIPGSWRWAQNGKKPTRNEIRILLPEESWISSIQAYLESKIIHEYLLQNLPRKNGKWQLNEREIKSLPIPIGLVDALRNPDPRSPWTSFISIAEQRFHSQQQMRAYSSWKDSSGSFRWHPILELLPPSDRVPFLSHPSVRAMNTPPMRAAIHKISSQKGGAPLVTVWFEQGLQLSLQFSDNAWKDLWISLFEDLRLTISHPTLEEMNQYSKLPQRIELAQELRGELEAAAYSEERQMLKWNTELEAWLNRNLTQTSSQNIRH